MIMLSITETLPGPRFGYGIPGLEAHMASAAAPLAVPFLLAIVLLCVAPVAIDRADRAPALVGLGWRY